MDLQQQILKIFNDCQQLINSADHLSVSRELNESDTDIIVQVVLDVYKDSSDTKPTVEEIKELFKEYLSKKEPQNESTSL